MGDGLTVAMANPSIALLAVADEEDGVTTLTLFEVRVPVPVAAPAVGVDCNGGGLPYPPCRGG